MFHETSWEKKRQECKQVLQKERQEEQERRRQQAALKRAQARAELARERRLALQQEECTRLQRACQRDIERGTNSDVALAGPRIARFCLCCPPACQPVRVRPLLPVLRTLPGHRCFLPMPRDRAG